MKILIIDGQGGGIGKVLIEKLRASVSPEDTITAVGTNALATSAMLRAGADEAATGENAIVVNSPKADVIAGVVGIVAANSMLGELTPQMAQAISASPAHKVLIPLNRCGITIAGVSESAQVSALVDEAARIIMGMRSQLA